MKTNVPGYVQFIFIFQIKHQTASAIPASTRHNKEKLSTNCAQPVTTTVVTTLDDSNFRPFDNSSATFCRGQPAKRSHELDVSTSCQPNFVLSKGRQKVAKMMMMMVINNVVGVTTFLPSWP